MKERLNIVDKIALVTKIMDISRDVEENLDIIGFEIGSTFYICKEYYGDEYIVLDEQGDESIVMTYENIMENEIFAKLLIKNRDAMFTLELAKKKYEEEFRKEISLENRIIKMLQAVVDKTPDVNQMKTFLEDNKEFMDGLDDNQKEAIDKLLKANGGDKNGNKMV